MASEVQELCRYTESDFLAAYGAVKQGMSVSNAAAFYKVPVTTLSDRIKNGHIVKPRRGKPPILTEEEEVRLVDWILNCWHAGFNRCKEREISAEARKLLEKSDRQHKQKFEFGRRWVAYFYQRQPRAKEVMKRNWNAQEFDSQHDHVRLDLWYERISSYLTETGLEQVLQQPKRLLHCMQLTLPLAGVMFAYSAAGMATPPLLVLPTEAQNVKLDLPTGWERCLQNNAALDLTVLQYYLEQVLHPYLAHTQTQFPVILFLHHQNQSLGLELFELCQKLDIVLINLYNQAYHKLQLLCEQSLEKWYSTPYGTQDEYAAFLEQLKNTLVHNLTKQNMTEAFSTAGIYPFSIGRANGSALALAKNIQTDAAESTTSYQPPLEQQTQLQQTPECSFEVSKTEMIDTDLCNPLDMAAMNADFRYMNYEMFKQIVGTQLLACLEEYNSTRETTDKSKEFLALHKIFKRFQQAEKPS